MPSGRRVKIKVISMRDTIGSLHSFLGMIVLCRDHEEVSEADAAMSTAPPFLIPISLVHFH